MFRKYVRVCVSQSSIYDPCVLESERAIQKGLNGMRGLNVNEARRQPRIQIRPPIYSNLPDLIVVDFGSELNQKLRYVRIWSMVLLLTLCSLTQKEGVGLVVVISFVFPEGFVSLLVTSYLFFLYCLWLVWTEELRLFAVKFVSYTPCGH